MKTKLTLTKWMMAGVAILAIGAASVSCQKDVRTDGLNNIDTPELRTLSAEQLAVIEYLPRNVIIAHRGTEYWAPEESEAAMRWARNMGADYLEIDVQRTKDGVILALHDDDLNRTTDVGYKFPNRKNDVVSSFTYEELMTLDIGTWFNNTYPSLARAAFAQEQVLTVQDVMMIAEGKRIKRNDDGTRVYTRTVDPTVQAYGGVKYVFEYEDDPADNQNRPGIYVETKTPYLFPNIERELKELFEEHGWYDDNINGLKQIQTYPNKVALANTPARVVMQTFSINSLRNMQQVFTRLIPICYLMYDVGGNVNTYADKINMAIDAGATIMGPMIDYVSGYPSSVQPWQGDMIRRTGMHIHAWSFNTQEQYIKYTGPWSDPNGEGGADKNYLDASFTNLTDMALNYYVDYLEGLKNNPDSPRNYFLPNSHLKYYTLPDNPHLMKAPIPAAQQVLDELGY